MQSASKLAFRITGNFALVALTRASRMQRHRGKSHAKKSRFPVTSSTPRTGRDA
jgi:hypothetical protein